MSNAMIFEVSSTAQAGIANKWETREPDRRFPCVIPSCFGGPGGSSTPEDFLAHALGNCFIGTFKVIAANSKFSFENIEVRTLLEIESPAPMKFNVKDAHLSVKVVGASDEAKLPALLRMTQKAGIILNAVSFPIKYS